MLFAPACGGADVRTESEVSESFARIQVGEARIATASLVARDPARGCPSRADASREVCAAADAVCAEAAPLEDADANARCEDARDACADATGGVRGACGAEGARSGG